MVKPVFAGGIISATLAYNLYFYAVTAEIEGYHIRYTTDYEFTYPWIAGMLYFIPIAFSPFVSAIKKMWMLGAMVLLSFTITALFYREYLIFVWCFLQLLPVLQCFGWCIGLKRCQSNY